MIQELLVLMLIKLVLMGTLLVQLVLMGLLGHFTTSFSSLIILHFFS